MNATIKNSILFLGLAVAGLSTKAQERSHFYTNLLNPFLVNPAMAGSQDNINAMFNARTFIGGIDASPRTLNFGLHSPGANNTGLGVKLISDWRGAFQTVNVEGAYSKLVRFKPDHTVTFGLSMGFVQTNLRSDMLNSQVNMADPTLSSSDLNKMRLSAGAGLVYRFKKKAEVTFSSPMMVTGDQTLNGFFVAGANYKFAVGENADYGLKPIVNYYNFVYAPKMVDILLAADWNETVMIQGGYRTNGTAVAGLGFNFKNLTIAYNYYHHTGDLNRLAPAQNEIAIAFNFAKPEKKLRKKNEVVSEQVIQDQIDKINDRVNGLINIEKTNPGLVNVKTELTKINRDLEKILTKYKIENIDQLKKIKELQVNIELIIAKYNEK